MTIFDLKPSRAAGVAKLAAFLPAMGRAYSDGRNTDLGPDQPGFVSRLSPYLRHRLITEQEVIEALLTRHSLGSANSFVSEVFWRTYWKGWLNNHPIVWLQYEEDVRLLNARKADDSAFRESVAAAEAGNTGIRCFDAWARELVQTGYLHNHARMWFASLWVFTLKLPWQAGADFFLRHLLDGDCAANTLSWRWVAGLQTRGKQYIADPENIRRFTQGRFAPTEAFAPTGFPVAETLAPPLSALPVPALPIALDPQKPTLLLLHEEDLAWESWQSLLPSNLAIVGAVALASPRVATQNPSAPVRDFVVGALHDSLGRWQHSGRQAWGVVAQAALPETLAISGAAQIVTPVAPIGPTATALDGLAAAGVPLRRLQRPWDALSWPFATKGFFPFREKIPKILRELGLPV